MRIGDHWQEGEVVERAKARRTYETFMHERPDVDPALLEHDTGNRVRARVFPIAPNERKEIIVSFSQELGGAPYHLPLAGLSTIEDFDTRVVVKTHDPARDKSSLSGTPSAQRVVEFRRSHFTPEKDLVVELDGATEAAGLHAGALAVVRVRPEADRPSAHPEAMLVLFDTSASAGIGFEDRVESFGRIIEALAANGDFRLQVSSFDQEIRTVFEGMASELHIDVLADLVDGRALGASNLEAALVHVSRSKQRWDRLLLVSDGMPTAGEIERGALRNTARELEAIGVRRIDALAPGARLERERLADLTIALPEPGVIVDDQESAEEVARGLTQAPFGEVAMTIEGASWSWPTSLQGVQPGEDVLVFAHYEGPRPAAVRVEFSDPSIANQEVETPEVEAPLLQRSWVRARIARIEYERAHLPPSADTTRAIFDDRIVALSTHYRVLDDRTALLVLETEADYRRFGIDRRGRADLLTVDGGTIRVLRRAETPNSELAVQDDLEIARLAMNDPDADVNADELQRNAGSSGIMGALTEESGHFLASPYGPAFADGNEDQDVWGGLQGTEVGEAFGVGGLGLGYDPELAEVFGWNDQGGLGLVGTGRGGGGTGEGTIGLGNTGLIGKGGGSGTGSGYGRGSGVGFSGRGRSVPRVRQAKIKVSGALDRDIVRRIARAHINEVRFCYQQGLARNPTIAGRVQVDFVIGRRGRVEDSVIQATSLTDVDVTRCIAKAVRRWKFPTPRGGGIVRVEMPFVFNPGDGVRTPSASASASGRGRGRGMMHGMPPRRRRVVKAAHVGRLAETRRLLAAGQTTAAYDLAWSWVQTERSDMLGLIALGEVLEARDRPRLAARVYGSLIDLHPSRPDVRRTAGERLERLDDEAALELAIDTYAKAAAARPDHPSGPRLHAWALVRRGDHAQAFEILRTAAERRYPRGRLAGVRTLLRQDLALVASAWLGSTQGDPHAQARSKIAAAGVSPDTEASARFVVTWETDTTDVDVLPTTRGSRRLHGRRIADVRTGYGPEARVLRGNGMPERLHAAVRYFDRGAMGHAMGTLQVITHDGAGDLRIVSRPFVLMQNKGVLDMGTFETAHAGAEAAT